MTAARSTQRPPAAFVAELRAALDLWAFSRGSRARAQTWRTKIARDRTAALEHLAGLRALINPSPPRLPPRELRAALAALDRLETSLSISGRWDLLTRFKLAPHRPSDKAVRDGLRAAMRRHQIDATTAARVIVRRIAPTLPQAARAALLGEWQTEHEQVEHVAENWLRRSR